MREVKPSYLTTEFWAVVGASLLLANVVTNPKVSEPLAINCVWALAAIVVTFCATRAYVKR